MCINKILILKKASSNKFKQNDYYPKRFGLKYDPPTISKFR